MPSLVRSSLFVVACVAWLPMSGREVKAQAPTYVGTFAMTNGASIKCLTNSSGGLGGSGNPAVTNPWAAVPGQEWAFLLLPNGFHAIFNIQTSLFLTAGGGVGSGMGQKPWTADLGQMWYLYPLGGHFYALVNVGNGGVLSDPSTGTQSGSTAETLKWADTLNQWWYLSFLYK